MTHQLQRVHWPKEWKWHYRSWISYVTPCRQQVQSLVLVRDKWVAEVHLHRIKRLGGHVMQGDLINFMHSPQIMHPSCMAHTHACVLPTFSLLCVYFAHLYGIMFLPGFREYARSKFELKVWVTYCIYDLLRFIKQMGSLVKWQRFDAVLPYLTGLGLNSGCNVSLQSTVLAFYGPDLK